MNELLFENEWLSVYSIEGWYIFSHESRSKKGELVAVLAFTENYEGDLNEILGRYEICPAHGPKHELTSINGGVEKEDTPDTAALRELWEEGGFKVGGKDLIHLGTIKPMASSDCVVHLYGVNVTDIKDLRREDSIGDGTKGEEGAYCKWLFFEDAIKNTQSAYLNSLILRIRMYLLGSPSFK
jgi:8-oxo-dGTP pyrophosphatase MutT (NUDIX family)